MKHTTFLDKFTLSRHPDTTVHLTAGETLAIISITHDGGMSNVQMNVCDLQRLHAMIGDALAATPVKEAA